MAGEYFGWLVDFGTQLARLASGQKSFHEDCVCILTNTHIERKL